MNLLLSFDAFGSTFSWHVLSACPVSDSTKHLYSPASSNWQSNKLSRMIPDLSVYSRCLLFSLICFPFRVHLVLGMGLPETRHSKQTSSPAKIVASCSCDSNAGATSLGDLGDCSKKMFDWCF